MEDKTISYLNKKWWYRLMKVSCIIVLATLFLNIVGILTSELPERIYLQKTGNSLPLERLNEISLSNNEDDIELIDNKYERLYSETKKTPEYLLSFFLYVFLSASSLLVILELSRRIFYYVFLGTFIPKKQ